MVDLSFIFTYQSETLHQLNGTLYNRLILEKLLNQITFYF